MLKESEQDTVVKRVLPYLRRRGYSDLTDLDFELGMKLSTRYAMGYADILVTCGKSKPQFVIEAKRSSKNLSAADIKQAVEYGRTLKTLFVAVTNGRTIRCYNTANSQALLWNGKLSDKMPSRDQLPKVLTALKANQQLVNLEIGDQIAPFRPSLPLKQLNALFKRCHNAIRKIEKNEESAFADFSKLLFLKLLEEKDDSGDFALPYTYRFHDLAEKPPAEADQVKTAILSMLQQIKDDLNYGDVLGDPIKLKSPKTYQYIVRELGGVYFADSNLDAKGAAFEYFVRATLKGKKLGQYFTPRPLIDLMASLCGSKKIVNALMSGTGIRILDPACGTGGFLVFLLNKTLAQVDELARTNQINDGTKKKLVKSLKADTFFGSDANHGVACSAKMNMIVAGDGHTNITPEDSLSLSSKNWNIALPDCDLILTNPPFGTSENASLSEKDLKAFPIQSGKGQNLFLQKMVLSTKPEGEICTVIDEGLLNTDSAADLRRWLLQQCRLLAVVRLPEETFKPNKINVRSSVLYFKRYSAADLDLENPYPVTFIDIYSLGYIGSGEPIRGFKLDKIIDDAAFLMRDTSLGSPREGYEWRSFDVKSSEIFDDASTRLDLKYWEPAIRNKIAAVLAGGGKSLKELNTIPSARGKSPSADLYVDEPDGMAAVLKAGSSISKYGEVSPGNDFIEEEVYAAMPKRAIVKNGDILLARTGDGTLGKCGVYTGSKLAIADGHVSVIRPDLTQVDPFYLADYLRVGFGAAQINRLYSGATGLIELNEDHIDKIVVDTLAGNLELQRSKSQALRSAEQQFRTQTELNESFLTSAFASFLE